MAYIKKYKKGTKIISLTGLGVFLDRGDWIYFRHKAYHPGFILSMQFKTVYQDVKRGYVYQAIRTQEKS